MIKTLFTFSLLACMSTTIADTIEDTNLPPRPIGQTVAGIVLCGLSIPLLVIGAAGWSTSQNDPNYQSGNYGLARFLGVAGLAEGCAGGILLAIAEKKWRLRARLQRGQNGNTSLYGGLLISYAF